MRDGGARMKCQCLPSTSISISQCGFSKVDFRILPVTVNDFDVSYPPQPWWAMAEAGARLAARDRNKRRLIAMASLRRSITESTMEPKCQQGPPASNAGQAATFPAKPLSSKSCVSRLHRIAAAVELAQIGQAAHGQPMRIVLARLHQRGEIFRHLGPRLVVGRGGAVHKQIIGLH